MVCNNIAILLSTYNGEKYLEAQFESLLKQSNKHWVCFIRDDNSMDKTIVLIDKYIHEFPDKFRKIQSNGLNLKPCKSFLNLMQKVDSFDYYMFCDQDDVWEENKIEQSLKAMKNCELEFDKEIPILIHSDLEVVNENLELISKSMKANQKVNYENNKINHLILQNNVTGCTVMMNKKLQELVKHAPPNNAVMHDWWVAMLASCFGEIVFINESLIKYRQHNNNSVGAKKISLFNSMKKLSGLSVVKMYKEYKLMMKRNIIQAQEFFEIYQYELSDETKIIIKGFAFIENLHWTKRIFQMKKYNIKGQNSLTDLLYKTIITFI